MLATGVPSSNTFGSTAQPAGFASPLSSAAPADSSEAPKFAFGASAAASAPAADQAQTAPVPSFSFGGKNSGTLAFGKPAGDPAPKLSFPSTAEAKPTEADEKPADASGNRNSPFVSPCCAGAAVC